MRVIIDVEPTRTLIRRNDGSEIWSQARPASGAAPLPPASLATAGEPDPIDGDVEIEFVAQPGVRLRLREALARVGARSSPAGELRRVGLWLGAVLFGDGWQSIEVAAGAEPLEIAVVWRPDHAGIPWELAMTTGGFLARLGRVAHLTRLLPRPATAPRAVSIASPMKTLFVVGSSVDDPVIRPGLEYLDVLRHLEDAALRMDAEVLVGATRKDVTATVKRMRPDVIHVIAHGGVTAPEGVGFLELRHDDGRSADSLAPAAFLELLGTAVPAVVVLNVCASAGELLQPGTPFAAELCAGGVPVVVGMGGPVTDRTCRLFARAFYKALLRGEGLAESVGRARREGVAGNAFDPDASPEWAQPRLFYAEGTDPRASVVNATFLALRQQAANAFAGDQTPRVFCDRLDVEVAWRELFSGETARRILAIRGAPPSQKREFGKSRLCRVLAVRAVNAGHVPVLLSLDRELEESLPTTRAQFVRQMASKIAESQALFGLPARDSLSLRYLNLRTDAGMQAAIEAANTAVAPLPTRVSTPTPGAIVNDPAPSLAAFGAALRYDLERLREDARDKLGTGTNVLVILDDLNYMHVATSDLVRSLIGTATVALGLGLVEPLPVVLAFAIDPKRAEEATAQQALIKLVGLGKTVNLLDIGPFAASAQPRAYREFLLGVDHPGGGGIGLMPAPDKVENVQRLLHKKIDGRPLNFLSDKTAEAIDTMLEMNGLQLADDSAALDTLFPARGSP